MAYTGVSSLDKQGNTLVVNWDNNGGMVLISGFCPSIFEDQQGNETFLKRFIDYEWAISPEHAPPVMCGLNWILELQRERRISEVDEALLAIKALKRSRSIGEFSAIYSNFNRQPVYKAILEGLRSYLEIIVKLVREDKVSRPHKKCPEDTDDPGCCVTDKSGYFLTKKAVEQLIAMVIAHPNLKDPCDPVMTEIYYRLKLIFGMMDGREIDAYVAATPRRQKLLAFDFLSREKIHVIKDYLNHAMHTEVQLQVAKTILGDDTNDTIISTKLPCWSCIRIPSLCSGQFHALSTGIYDDELSVYPADIYPIGEEPVLRQKNLEFPPPWQTIPVFLYSGEAGRKVRLEEQIHTIRSEGIPKKKRKAADYRKISDTAGTEPYLLALVQNLNHLIDLNELVRIPQE